jgi:hypothetical protein
MVRSRPRVWLVAGCAAVLLWASVAQLVAVGRLLLLFGLAGDAVSSPPPTALPPPSALVSLLFCISDVVRFELMSLSFPLITALLHGTS